MRLVLDRRSRKPLGIDLQERQRPCLEALLLVQKAEQDVEGDDGRVTERERLVQRELERLLGLAAELDWPGLTPASGPKVETTRARTRSAVMSSDWNMRPASPLSS